MARRLDTILVVIPAHNEEQLIGGCLSSIAASTAHLRRTGSRIAVRIVLVLDSCTDHTERIARSSWLDASTLQVLSVNQRNVGASRAKGVQQGLQSICSGMEAENTWIACTDADTRVPEHWLAGFASAYLHGADAVTGTVEPDREQLPEHVFDAWRSSYTLDFGHPHIHGANLGISAAAYQEVGGFAPLCAHEDVDLIQRVRSSGLVVEATDQLHAVTSGRLSGRLSEGFADYLSALARRGPRFADSYASFNSG